MISYEHPRRLLTYATWKRQLVISMSVSKLTVREKRHIYAILRETNDHNAFLPQYGFTAGSFCMWQIVCESRRAKRNQRLS